MRRVRLKTLMAGPLGIHQPGTIIDSADAAALIAGGYAEAVEQAVALPVVLPAAEALRVETPEPTHAAPSVRARQR